MTNTTKIMGKKIKRDEASWNLKRNFIVYFQHYVILF